MTFQSPKQVAGGLGAAQSEDDRVRAIVDLIAGMTEQQAIQMYQRLAGISLGSVLVSFVR
jgi:dGTP triphosphohydrolase